MTLVSSDSEADHGVEFPSSCFAPSFRARILVQEKPIYGERLRVTSIYRYLFSPSLRGLMVGNPSTNPFNQFFLKCVILHCVLLSVVCKGEVLT